MDFKFQRIAELRTKNKMSQKELGERLSVSNQAISKWESGISMPSLEKAHELSRLFRVPMDFFLTVTNKLCPILRTNVWNL